MSPVTNRTIYLDRLAHLAELELGLDTRLSGFRESLCHALELAEGNEEAKSLLERLLNPLWGDNVPHRTDGDTQAKDRRILASENR